MRINVYTQELTDEIEAVEKKGTNDVGTEETFRAVRMFLQSPDTLHHTDDDDDRSAITIWIPDNPERKKALAATLMRMANVVATGSTLTPEANEPTMTFKRSAIDDMMVTIAKDSMLTPQMGELLNNLLEAEVK